MFVEPESPLLYFSHLKSDPAAWPGDPEQLMEYSRDHVNPDPERVGHRDLLSYGDIVDGIKPAPDQLSFEYWTILRNGGEVTVNWTELSRISGVEAA